jgi:hypothetical protein
VWPAFGQVEGGSDADRDEAWKRIKAAGGKYGVEINEESWRELEKGTAARERSTKHSGWPSGSRNAPPSLPSLTRLVVGEASP